jgi:hypothetical protein
LHLLFPFPLLTGHGLGHVSRETASIYSISKVCWGKMGIPEGCLNITVAKNLFYRDQIYSRHDPSIRCGKVVVTDATYIMGDGGYPSLAEASVAPPSILFY